MRRVAPVVVLATVAAITILGLLLTSGPAAVTLRAVDRPVHPLGIDDHRCLTLPVLPDETTGLRVRPVPGIAAPAGIAIETGDPDIPGGLGPIASQTIERSRTTGDGDLVFTLHGAPDTDVRRPRVCFLGPPGAQLMGEAQPSITLLGAHRSNWLSALPLLADRAGFGRGTVLGRAALPLGILAAIAAWVLALRLGSGAMRRPDRISRRTVALIGAVASLWGLAFAVTTPPFQAPDELAHLRYAELLQDTHAVPRTTVGGQEGYSPQLRLALPGVEAGRAAFFRDRRTPWTQVEDRALDAALHRLPAGGSRDTFDNASSQPPTYYAVIAVADAVAGGSILDRLLVARLVSALLFGLGVAGAVAFAHEAVPRAGGLVVAAGLALACMPLIGFIGGSVNPDALLLITASWSLAVTARILRRGLTWRLAVALGALIGLGMISKLTFAGLLPMFVAAGLVVVVRGVRGTGGGRSALMVAGAAAVAAVVSLPYLGWALASGRGIAFSAPSANVIPPFSTGQLLSYTVELFLGQRGPIPDRIPGSGPLDIWASGLVGRLGWLDYGFPRHVVLAVAAIWFLLALLAVVGLVRAARARRAFPADALVYAVGVLGLALLIARAGLINRQTGAQSFEQARYLLPVAGIGVGGIALALRQLPRPKLRDWAAGAIVAAALVHGTAGYLITIGRYFA